VVYWANVSGAGSPRLSWLKDHSMVVVVSCPLYVQLISTYDRKKMILFVDNVNNRKDVNAFVNVENKFFTLHKLIVASLYVNVM